MYVIWRSFFGKHTSTFEMVCVHPERERIVEALHVFKEGIKDERHKYFIAKLRNVKND